MQEYVFSLTILSLYGEREYGSLKTGILAYFMKCSSYKAMRFKKSFPNFVFSSLCRNFKLRMKSFPLTQETRFFILKWFTSAGVPQKVWFFLNKEIKFKILDFRCVNQS